MRICYVGRLSKEKGVHLLVDALPHICEKYGFTVEFHFFGDGPLCSQVVQLANQYEQIHYYGHKPKEEVFTIWKKCHYTIMPSLFLETFGLSALDSISLGVPVVGFDKGGLAQFLVDDALIIRDDQSVGKKLDSLIQSFSKEHWNNFRDASLTLYQQYSRDHRLRSFESYSGLKPGARVALVSDYGIDIGGIENRLLLVQEKLCDAGYIVEFIGGIDHKPTSLRRLLGLFLTAWNIYGGVSLYKKLKRFSPDLVWYHSVHRVFGPFPLLLSSGIGDQKRVMYHDFGLFHPYPSKVYSTQQVEKAATFWGYFLEGWKVNPRVFPFYVAKFLQKKIVLHTLHSFISKQFVPSKYMEQLLIAHGIPVNSLYTLPHFIRSIGQGEQ